MVRRIRPKINQHGNQEMEKILRGILSRNNVDDWEYSFGGRQEGRLCMDHNGRTWRVYFVERGLTHKCSVFPTEEAAAKELLRRLGREENQRRQMLSEFSSTWLAVGMEKEGNPVSPVESAAKKQTNAGMITIPVRIAEPRPALAMRKNAAGTRKKKQDTIGIATTVSRPGIIGGKVSGGAFIGGLKKVKGLPVSPTVGRSTKGKSGTKAAARQRSSARTGIRGKGF